MCKCFVCRGELADASFEPGTVRVCFRSISTSDFGSDRSDYIEQQQFWFGYQSTSGGTEQESHACRTEEPRRKQKRGDS